MSLAVSSGFQKVSSIDEAKRFAGGIVAYIPPPPSPGHLEGRFSSKCTLNDVNYGLILPNSYNWGDEKEGLSMLKLVCQKDKPGIPAFTSCCFKQGSFLMQWATPDEMNTIKKMVLTGAAIFGHTTQDDSLMYLKSFGVKADANEGVMSPREEIL